MSEMYTVRHNVSAMFAHRQSTLNNGTLNRALERLSSGYRINRSSDDVAGLAVSEKLRTQVRGFHRAAMNIQDGISFLQTGDAALQDVHDIFQRMRELLVQSANGVYTDSDRSLIQQEIDQLLDEVNRIHNTTEFNKKRVFNFTAADIVWIVDGTGSMAGVQADLIAEAPNFVNQLTASNIDYRLGVVRYGGPGPAVAIGGMTTDVATFSANIGAVGTGVGPQENAMQALTSTLSIFSYRNKAKKIFILLTDEDADDGGSIARDPATGDYTPLPKANDLLPSTAATMNSNDTPVYAVTDSSFDAPGGIAGPGEDVELAAPSNPLSIASRTGGQIFTSFAGFSATLSAAVDALISDGVTLHVGANEAQTFDSVLQTPISTAALGVAGRITAATQLAAESSLSFVDSAINQITRVRSSIGAEINRLEFSLDYDRVAEEALQSSESRIRDTDMASEIIDFTKNQVLVQAANAMLAQANLLPQNVLSLLG